jgi:monoamine oxidase
MHLFPLWAMAGLPPSIPTSACPATVDVAIVGAGLAGLSAAIQLSAANKSVLVIEARDRVGGRVLNAKLPGGGVTEVGAQFIGPTQDRVIALAAELGLETFATYNTGENVLWQNGTRSTYSTSGLDAAPPIDDLSLLQLATALDQLDTMAMEINVTAPWTHPRALEWDSMTFGSWLDNATPLQPARSLLDVATTSIFSAEPRELSLLYTLAYIASAGNETTPGSIGRLTSTTSGAQDRRVKGGTQLLAIRLAERLGVERIALSAPVRQIEKTDSGYMVTADGLVVQAKHVVIAMSPPLAARIIYDPILPAKRDQLTQRLPMGSIGKAIALYDTPFWRADGLTGQAVSDSGVVRSTFDSSPEDGAYGAMMGFIEADEMRKFDDKSEAEIQAEVVKDFVNYFGPKAAHPTSWVIQRWDNEEFSRGGPVAFAPPGVLTQYGSALTQRVEGIHFAGTESAAYWTGYMDGAVRSGERVAREILGTHTLQ